MKLSPLLLFLLLVLILVISVVVCKNLTYPLSEGFVSYNVNVLPSNTATINSYSSTPVVKMFDNLFFDNKNGNVIEVDSSQFIGNVNTQGNYISGNVDNTGASIKNLYISTRDGSLHSYPSSTTSIPESGISTVASSYNNFTYNTKCQTTGKYEMFYIPWNTDTYIHIIETSYVPSYYGEPSRNPTNVYTYKFTGESSGVSAVRYVNSQLPINAASSTTDASINSFVYDSFYGSNRPVYKLSSSFEFDASNANLIVRYPNAITVYGRSQNVVVTSNQPLQNAGLSNVIPSASYNAWVVNDVNNSSQLVYVANGTNTLLLVINKNASGSYDLANVARFNSNGLDNGNASPVPGPSPSPNPLPTIPDISGNAISDYYKWYWYWNSVGGGNKFSDNYILKTQIVPPVCPKCPNCPDFSGACVNCGGTGGSGTTINNGKSVVNNTVSTVGNVAETTVDAAGNVIVGAEKAVGTAVGGVASGVGSAVGGVASGVGSAVGGLASGVAGVANNAITTTGNVANNLINASEGTGSSQGYGQPGFSKGSPPIDNYSYYGALPSKSANYMPITADFSKFGK